MRVFLYARDSMDEIGTEREQNPELQLFPMREECQRRSWNIEGEFIDRISGGELLRDQFHKMLQAAARKECDLVMVWKADRFCRFKPSEAIVVLYELESYGIAFYSLTEPYMSTLPENPIPEEWRTTISSIIFSAAYAERKKISERTKAGIAAKKLTGDWHGGRPKGSKDKQERKSPRFKPDIRPGDLFKPS